MPTAAIYARFSTEKQSEASIEDQFRICRARAVAERWAVCVEHGDDGISGATPVASRPAGRQLLADALARRFDVLLLEGLDRLSRDMVESERVVRRLEHAGIRIVGISDGYDSQSAARKLHRGMRGILNEVYLDDLRAKTHRGLAGQILRGFHAGGISYGYRSVPVDGGFRMELDAAAAEWVRWIFREYGMRGRSPQSIAHELNRMGVPSPRGSTWAVSALYGSPSKGSGVLNNELYVGRYIWNRSQWLRDPDTGKRTRIDRPREEWSVVDRPELRILDDELWSAARLRMDQPRSIGQPKTGRAPRTLFGGLLRCGRCGGPVCAVDRLRYGCSAAKERGPTVCAGVAVRRADVDARLVSALRDELLSPESLAELQRAIGELARDNARQAREAERDARARRAELERELANLTDAIATLGASASLGDRLRSTERELARIDAAPAADPDRVERIAGEEAVRRYREMMLALREALEADREQARVMIGQMFGAMVIEERGAGEIWATPETKEPALRTGAGSLLSMVAGARFCSWRPLRIS